MHSASIFSRGKRIVRRFVRRLALVAVAAAAVASNGCAASKWTVRPHQRELLADRIMSLDADRAGAGRRAAHPREPRGGGRRERDRRAEGAVATETPRAPDPGGERPRRAGARRRRSDRGVRAPDVLSRAVDRQQGDHRHSPAGRRRVADRRRPRHRGRAGRPTRSAARRPRCSASTRSPGHPVPRLSPAGPRRLHLQPPGRRHRRLLRLRLGERLPVALALRHRARRSLRPQLHADALLHATTGTASATPTTAPRQTPLDLSRSPRRPTASHARRRDPDVVTQPPRPSTRSSRRSPGR